MFGLKIMWFGVLIGLGALVYFLSRIGKEKEPYKRPNKPKSCLERAIINPKSVTEEDWIMEFKTYSAMKAEQEMKEIIACGVELPDKAYAFLRKKIESSRKMSDEEFRKMNEE